MHVWRRSGNGFVQAHSGTGLEGVIAKKKDSLYFKGKRTKSWLKMKHLIDYDFVVCWYVDKGKHYKHSEHQTFQTISMLSSVTLTIIINRFTTLRLSSKVSSSHLER